MHSVSKFKALLDRVLAPVVRSLLRGSDWYNFGKLVNEASGNSVSQVQKNIVGNIETILEFAFVSRYLLATVSGLILYSKPPANGYIASNC